MADEDIAPLIVKFAASLVASSATGDPVLALAGFAGSAYDLVRKIWKDQKKIHDLEDAFQDAQICFARKCKNKNQDLLPFKDWIGLTPGLEKAIKDLPDQVNEEGVRQNLIDQFSLMPEITPEQARRAVDLYESCLRQALGPVKDYTLTVIRMGVQRLEEAGKQQQLTLDQILAIVQIILTEIRSGQIVPPKTLEQILQPLDFTEELHRTPRFYGRQWLLEKVQAWLVDPDAPQIFWLTAEPGVGKTAFAAWLAGQMDAPVHFCNAGIPEKNDPARLVRSLAFQLSRRLAEGYGGYLLQAAESEKEKDPGSLFDCLLTQPLAGEGFAPPAEERPLLIVIDGLDEANDPQTGNRIAKLISENAGRLPPWLRILVTSRSHARVMEWLQGVEPQELPAEGEDNLDDLRLFIREGLQEFNGGRVLPDSLVEDLLQKSEGNFLYIEYLRKELKENHLHLKDARSFPLGLNGMYREFFERQFPDRQVYSAQVRPALQLAAAAYEALPLAQIAEWLGWTAQMRLEFEEAAGGLFTLQGERLAAPHRTLLEWVADARKATTRFWANPQEGHRILAQKGWKLYKKAGVKGLDGYLLRRLPFHLLAAGKKDELAALLGNLVYIGRLMDENQFLLFEAWGRAEEAGLNLEAVYGGVVQAPQNHPPELLFNLALMLQQIGQAGLALALYEYLVQVYREKGDDRNLQASMGNQALILMDQGELGEAMRLLKEIEQIFRQLNDPDGLQKTLGNQALILQAQGELGEAMRLLKEKEALCRRLNDPAGLQASLGNQALILQAQGELGEAMRLLKEIEQIFRQLNDPDGLQKTLGNQALILQAQGELGEAMRLHKEEEEICRRLNNWEGLSISLANQAGILAQQGDRPGALELSRQALEMAEAHGYVVLARQIRGIIQWIEGQDIPPSQPSP